MSALLAARAADVLEGLRDLRNRAANNFESDAALRINIAIQWAKEATAALATCDKASRIASDLGEVEQYLLDAVKLRIPAFDPPQLLSPLVTIRCGAKMPTQSVFDLAYPNDSQVGEVRDEIALHFEHQTTNVDGDRAELTYSVTLIERDEYPRLTAREAGLAAL